MYQEYNQNYPKTQFGTFPNKIAIPVDEGYVITDYQNLMYCTAQGNQTELFLRDGRRIQLNKQLKALELLLPSTLFFRVHQSHLVNLDHVEMWLTRANNVLCLSNGTRVKVGRTRRKELIKRLHLMK